MKHEAMFVMDETAPSAPLGPTPAEGALGNREGVKSIEQAEAVYESLTTYLRANKLLLNTFAEDTSLRYVIPGKAGSFAIYMDTGEIHVPLEWFMEREYSKDQVLWACLHEVAHFRELMDDLPGEKNNREQILKKAKEMAVILEKKAEENFGESNPEYVAKLKEQKKFPSVEGETISAVENVVYGYYHTLQNVLRDVYVNNYVARKAPAYSKTAQAGKEVTRLYKERLFRETDYRSNEPETVPVLVRQKQRLPRHLQFIYKIIREEMVPEEATTVDDDVAEMFQRKMKYKGRSYTVKEILDSFMKPRAGRDTKLTTRTEVASKTIEVLFDELLRKDLEELEVPKPKSKNSNANTGSGSSGMSDNNAAPGNEEAEEGPESIENSSPEESTSDETEELNPTIENSENPAPEEADETPEISPEETPVVEPEEIPVIETEPTPEPASPEPIESEPVNPEVPEPIETPDDPPNESDLDPFKDFYKELNENEIDQFDENQIDNFIKKQEDLEEQKRIEKEKEEEERQKKAEQKRKEFQEQLDNDFCATNNINPDTLRQFRKIQETIKPYLDELSHLWDNIIYGSTKGVNYQMEGHYTTGSRLDVKQVIKDFSEIQKGASEPRVYKKRVESLTVVEKPELIRVRILGDISGSMLENGKEKTLRDVVVLLLSSLHEFNDRLLALKRQSGSKTWVDTEVWKFGNEGSRVKKLTGSPDVSDERDVITSFNDLQADGRSSTNNTDVLEKISSSIDSADSAKIKSGKIMDLIFEITDGVPNDAGTTKDAIDNLEEQGVIIRAFQIGASESEVEVFNTIWNSPEKERGFVVGNDISQLIPAVVNSLKEHLSGIRL
jgi:hypothetical protein